MSWPERLPRGSDNAVVMTALGGWLVLLATPRALGLPALCGSPDVLAAVAAGAWRLAAATISPGRLLAGWAGMALAMMLPLAAPQLRHIVRRGGPGAPLGVAAFLTSWLAVWIMALAVLAALGGLLTLALGAVGAVAAAFLFALGWQHTPTKYKALRRCHACPPLPWERPALAAACLRLGFSTGTHCIAGCWAVMLATMVLPWPLLAMLGGSALLWTERYWRRMPLGWPLMYR